MLQSVSFSPAQLLQYSQQSETHTNLNFKPQKWHTTMCILCWTWMSELGHWLLSFPPSLSFSLSLLKMIFQPAPTCTVVTHTSADWMDRRVKLQADWWAMLERLLACAGACIFHPWLKAYAPYNRDSVSMWVSGNFLHIWQRLALLPDGSPPPRRGGLQPYGVCGVAGSVWLYQRAIFISACFPGFVKAPCDAFQVTWSNLPK